MVVSLGHSMADLSTAEQAVVSGASLITHLFNAMLPVRPQSHTDTHTHSYTQFHHRDPGIVGLLTSQSLGGAPVYYSLIADGHHTHETVQRIAYQAYREGKSGNTHTCTYNTHTHTRTHAHRSSVGD